MQCWIYGSFPMKSGDFLQLKADLLGFNVKAVTCALNIQNLDGIQWMGKHCHSNDIIPLLQGHIPEIGPFCGITTSLRLPFTKLRKSHCRIAFNCAVNPWCFQVLKANCILNNCACIKMYHACVICVLLLYFCAIKENCNSCNQTILMVYKTRTFLPPWQRGLGCWGEWGQSKSQQMILGNSGTPLVSGREQKMGGEEDWQRQTLLNLWPIIRNQTYLELY